MCLQVSETVFSFIYLLFCHSFGSLFLWRFFEYTKYLSLGFFYKFRERFFSRAEGTTDWYIGQMIFTSKGWSSARDHKSNDSTAAKNEKKKLIALNSSQTIVLLFFMQVDIIHMNWLPFVPVSLENLSMITCQFMSTCSIAVICSLHIKSSERV